MQNRVAAVTLESLAEPLMSLSNKLPVGVFAARGTPEGSKSFEELIENALDAGATRVDVIMRDGGRTAITVTDNGMGMSREELEVAVERHATSKLKGEDLTHITSLGFRGEALPSIGAVSRMTITTRAASAGPEESAWSLSVEGGRVTPPEPAALGQGTRIEVRDLFYATPARLKFLKAPRTEYSHAVDVIERLAMAQSSVANIDLLLPRRRTASSRPLATSQYAARRVPKRS